ncbi:MAG TPA: metal-dependent hydrolase [Acidimicrobiales bacterium]|nr:metal-dependent hydrolase [Acidimicrobiales bacterium]
MGDLQVRQLPFTFDGVEFLWNPANPAFSVFVNCISFWVIGLERYLVRIMKDADAHITDPRVRREARIFTQQEAVHSKAHRRHVKALIDRYPRLQAAVDSTVAHYDELYDGQDLRYHLAYAAALEGTFTPVFGMLIDCRDTLFREGDARVASLCLWHFCEEIEHRSSAVMVYDHVVGDHLYKMRVFPSVVTHVERGFESLLRQFREHVPGESEAEHYGTKLTRILGGRANPLATVPVHQRLRVAWRATASILGNYDHDHQPTPAWADTWFAHYDRGDDMTRFYGRVVEQVSA